MLVYNFTFVESNLSYIIPTTVSYENYEKEKKERKKERIIGYRVYSTMNKWLNKYENEVIEIDSVK